MKLVFVTQTLDPEHAALAQTVDLVRALAKRVEEVAVVSRHLNWDAVPSNVTVRTFDARSKIGRSVAFERALQPSLGQASGVLVHMVPEFLLLAAAPTRLRRIPLLLWYTHWHAGRALRVATPFCSAVLTVDRASFPLASAKVRPIGHAIDVERFSGPPLAAHEGSLKLLSIGRTARWKGLATLLDALSLAIDQGLDATLEMRGPSLTEDERAHRREIEAQIASDDRLRDRAWLAEAVGRSEIPATISGSDVIVSPNEPRSGATFDKAVYEAAACARPVVSTNQAFAPLLSGLPLELLAQPSNPHGLADVLMKIAAAPTEQLVDIGTELRRRVVEQHSLDHWADTVISIVREVRSPRGG